MQTNLMKNYLVVALILISGFAKAQDHELLDRQNVTFDEFEETLDYFRTVNDITPRQFFNGCLSVLILTENDFLQFDLMNDRNAPRDSFELHYRNSLNRIAISQGSIMRFAGQNWNELSQFSALSIKWLNTVKSVMDNELSAMFDQFTRSSKTWTDAERKLYDDYTLAYDKYLEVDGEWVNFQHVFAKANDFSIEGEVQLNMGMDSNGLDASTQQDFIRYAKKLTNGEVTNAQMYFEGVLGYVIQIDAYYMRFATLDEEDAKLVEFTKNVNQVRSLIFDVRKAMALYKGVNYSKKKEFDSKTNKWLKSIESLVEKYMVKLIEPMSRPDATWTAKELKFHDKKYLPALNKYFDIDQDWVDFQQVFAIANGFEISGEVNPDSILK